MCVCVCVCVCVFVGMCGVCMWVFVCGSVPQLWRDKVVGLKKFESTSREYQNNAD